MILQNDDAVSPVVGVMLMLVVTIIIAAVVSSFAGGLANEEDKTPQVILTCTPVIKGVYDSDKTNDVPDSRGHTFDNGIMFEHQGGEGFGLDDIEFQLQYENSMATIKLEDTFTQGSCVSGDVDAYFMEYGDDDGFITPGDKFMVYADNCRIKKDEDTDKETKFFTWKPAGSKGLFSAPFNQQVSYSFIDRASGKAIQSGSIVIH
ncbi:type IV pilin N-terminal domain-containing protein [Methanogenium cariaci]|jgi:archaeal type IV pilus assembly protein PilA